MSRKYHIATAAPLGPAPSREACNAFRYDGGPRGHYESYFQRANHPTRPLAFWIRYTVFSPRERPESALGELWAIYFDGEAGRIAAVKQVWPFASCSFSRERLAVRIGDAQLDAAGLDGSARDSRTALRWSLNYSSPERPLLLFPSRLYSAPLPKAKALVGSPLARFRGALEVQGERVEIDDWVGSQNHNWGEKHTDRYAWGQVAGFDEDPSAFLECATASIRVGPLYTPPISPIVLRVGGEELRFNQLHQALRTRATYQPFTWQLAAKSGDDSIELELSGAPSQFVALPYDNPPGGRKICLNSKIAACTLRLTRRGRAPLTLSTRHRAAFEILRDDPVPGVMAL
jgi:hypothetical protein